MNKTKQVEVLRVALPIYSEDIFGDIEEVKRNADFVLATDDFSNPKCMIEGVMEPSENYPNDLEIVVYASRPMTQAELEKEEIKEELKKEAKKLGITFYEMKQLDNLRKKGVVK